MCIVGKKNTKNHFKAGDFKVHIDIKDLQYDDKLMKLDVNTKRSDTKTTVNIRGEIFNDISDPILARFASFEKVDGKLMHLVNGTSSICNVMSRFMSHPILKYIVEELLKSSNIPTACPVKKVGQSFGSQVLSNGKIFLGKLRRQRLHVER